MSITLDALDHASPLTSEQLRAFLVSALTSDHRPGHRTHDDYMLLLSPDQVLRTRDRLRLANTTHRFRVIVDFRFHDDGRLRDATICEYDARRNMRGVARGVVRAEDVVLNNYVWETFLQRMNEDLHGDVRFPLTTTRGYAYDFERFEFGDVSEDDDA